MNKYIAVTVLSLGLLCPAAVMAEDTDPISGYIAGGVFATSDYEGSNDYQAIPLLSGKINYNHYYIETRGLGVRLNLSPSLAYDFGPVLSYKMSRDDDVDNNRVARLREVDSAFEAGAFVTFPIAEGISSNSEDKLVFDGQVIADASGTYEGYLVSFGTTYSYPFSRTFRVSTGLSATYVDENYMQTYFGVDANNAARSGLSQFSADSGFKDVGLSLTANYGLSKKWGLIGIVGYDRLIGDAADSPLVDDEGSANQFMIGTGLTYRF